MMSNRIARLGLLNDTFDAGAERAADRAAMPSRNVAPMPLDYARPSTHLLRRQRRPVSLAAVASFLASIATFPAFTADLIENYLRNEMHLASGQPIGPWPLVVPCIIALLFAILVRSLVTVRDDGVRGLMVVDLSILIDILWIIPLLLHGSWILFNG